MLAIKMLKRRFRALPISLVPEEEAGLRKEPVEAADGIRHFRRRHVEDAVLVLVLETRAKRA